MIVVDPRMELLKTAPPNKCVAISADETRIVAIGDSVLQVTAQCEAMGETDAVLMKTPPVWGAFYL